MFKIEDGRNSFFQWDIDRRLIIDDETVNEVHFCNRTDECSLVCEVYEENGKRLVNVPNILLQTDWRIKVYAYDSKYTKHCATYDVVKRTKPADYVYTETETLNYNSLLERIETLEGGSIDVDLSGYYTKEEVDNAIAEIELTPGPAGKDGEPGKDGYTPVKGIDYFDGAPGKDGIDGKDYVLTDTDKNEIAQLAIELIPAAEDGEY